MATYAPLTSVMPLASMVTGAPVTAALGDQIRDNLVALNDGWWFRASRSTGFTSVAAVVTPVGLDTLALSQTCEDEGSASLVSNTVQVNKAGLWLVGGHFTFAAASLVALVGVSYTDAIAGHWAFESLLDTSTGTQTDVCGVGGVEVITVPATFTLQTYTSLSTAVAASARSPIMWGVWMGDRP